MIFFLKLKHWQVFLVTVIGFILFPFILLYDILHQLSVPNGTNINTISLPFFIYSIHYTIFIYYFLLWNLIVNLNKLAKIKNQFLLNLLFFTPLILILFILNILTKLNLPFIIFTISLFLSLFVILLTTGYCVYYTAKKINLIYRKKQINFSDYFLDAILLFLFPIGVWLIQPKINKIFKDI